MSNQIISRKKSKREKFRMWCREHKKELITGGIIITGVFATIVILVRSSNDGDKQEHIDILENVTSDNNLDLDMISSEEILNAELSTTENTCTTKASHDVNEHIRNLPKGWKASKEKILTAEEHGFDLKPEQTWVKSYTTEEKAA